MYNLFRELVLGFLCIHGQGVMIVTYTYLLTVLVKTASVSSAPWRKKPVNSSVNLPISIKVSNQFYVSVFKLTVKIWGRSLPHIPKRRNSNGMDNPDAAAAPIDSSNTNLSHFVAYEKILYSS